MKLICVLVLILLSSRVDGSVDKLILGWFSRECLCNWSQPFLLGAEEHTVLYVDRDSVSEIDFKESTLIDRKSKLKSDYFDDYFTGCLIRPKSDLFYVVIHQDRILNLTSRYFSDATQVRYLRQKLQLKDNPRLLYTKLDALMDRQTNELLDYHKLSVSTSTPLELNLSYSLVGRQVVSLTSRSSHLSELYLLQALLNQDFDQFSSDEDSEVFGEDNVLLVYSKKLETYETFQVASIACLFTTESYLFVKLMTAFSVLLLVFSFAFDYLDPFKYDLKALLQHFIRDEKDNIIIKYCLDTFTEKDRSVDSIRTIDSASEINICTWKKCAYLEQS